jgi:hypothetical protein
VDTPVIAFCIVPIVPRDPGFVPSEAIGLTPPIPMFCMFGNPRGFTMKEEQFMTCNLYPSCIKIIM